MRLRIIHQFGAQKLWLATLACSLFFGCSSKNSGGHTPRSDQTIFKAQHLYPRYCATCHDASDLQLIDKPPSLNGLFQKSTFPSGAPATDDELRNVILHGRGTMPPFEGTLTADDVNALVQFLHAR